MSQPISKKSPKFFLIASLGLLIPIVLLAIIFLAAKSDQNTQKEYQQIRQKQAEKLELQKQQQLKEQNQGSN